MSLTCSDCFSDLLCCEDAGIFTEEDATSEYSSRSDLVLTPQPQLPDSEESIAALVEEEGAYLPEFDYSSKFQSESLDASARRESIAWILKAQRFYRFQPLTAYLSVNYIDRFLSSRHLPQSNGWPLQLLSVACLSLAAKMEEPQVPNLMDIQVDGKFLFESTTLRKMEFLVLGTLDWRLRSITPFNFIDFFANKADLSGSFVKLLVSHATRIILASIRETSFLNYPPSSMAAAAILCAANEIPNLCFVGPESSVKWCKGLSKERIIGCYKLMQDVHVVDDFSQMRKPPKVLPQLRVTARTWITSLDSPSSSSPSNKRRKIDNTIWVSEEKDIPLQERIIEEEEVNS